MVEVVKPNVLASKPPPRTAASAAVVIRKETAGDAASIDAVTRAAFFSAPRTSHTEHHIVRALRRSNRLAVSLVATIDGDVVGHIAMSPVMITDGSTGWYGLGPLSVEPLYQGRGVGRRLVESGLAALRELGGKGCVVLGDAAYYGRFGFRAVAGLTLPDLPPEYFLALPLGGAVPSGTVTYHESFFARN